MVDTYSSAFVNIMDRLGLSEWEIPDELWRKKNPRPRLTPEQRHDLKLAVSAGMRVSDVCKKIGCSEKTVRKYK